MGAIGYYLVLPLIFLISILPFSVLYVISDIFFIFIYHIIGYRKEIVKTNLSNAFPEKTAEEIKIISEKFYRYLCDLILETFKTLTITPAEVKKHVLFDDDSILKKYYTAKQSVILVLGHWGNWELVGARFSQDPLHQLYTIYHPLANKHFDRLFYYMRTRLGNKLYKMNEALRGILNDRDKISVIAFLSDQTPSPHGAYWTTFLNQDTPIFTGAEKIAKKLNYPVIYGAFNRVKRGLYSIELEEIAAFPNSTSENEISELHAKRLEKDIIRQPEIWLWTHRRWKHKRPSKNLNNINFL